MTTSKIVMMSVLIFALMLFMAPPSSAADLQSEKECQQKAYKLFQSKGYEKMRCGLSTHYNSKNNSCFSHVVCESNKGKKVQEYVVNIGMGQTFAQYINTRPSTPSGSCVVNGKQCRDYYEFHDMIKPYMEN